MSVSAGERDLLELFGSLSARELRAVCLDSLRDLVPREKPVVKPVTLGPAVVRAAAHLKGRSAEQAEAMAGKWVHCVQQLKPELLGVAGFLWSLVGAGLAVPGANPDGWHVPTIVLTREGWEFVNSGDLHPLQPGAVERVKTACPGIPAQVLDLLTDASACLAHGLVRPAIALLGFAYEATIDEVLDQLDTKGYLQNVKIPWGAGDRLKLLRSKLAIVLPDPAKKEERQRAELACDLAEKIRDRRNEASHPKLFTGAVHDEVADYLTSGFRRLPDLWAIQA